MSSAASWSYTATATHWPRVSLDGWEQTQTFGAPVSFSCDYTAKAERVTDELGVEFVTRQMLYTERATIKRGDRVLIGLSTNPDPIAAGADEVRAVQRFGDTLERKFDDFVVMT
jgi:hypothetical protein